jgi:hypothetical protein
VTKTAAPVRACPDPIPLDKGSLVLGHLLTEPFLRFGLNSLLWWLVVALSFVLLLAPSLRRSVRVGIGTQ